MCIPPRWRWYTPRVNVLVTAGCAVGAVLVIGQGGAPVWGKLVVLALAAALVAWAWRSANERMER